MCDHTDNRSATATPRRQAQGASEGQDARLCPLRDLEPASVSRIFDTEVVGGISGWVNRGRSAAVFARHWFAALCWVACVNGCSPARAAGPDSAYVDRVISAIYRVEGGAKTKYPYGIKSVKVSGTAEAKRVCQNTVRNNWKRWERAGRPGDYLDFLADRYCPPSVDPQGNFRWKNNIHQILTCQIPQIKGPRETSAGSPQEPKTTH